MSSNYLLFLSKSNTLILQFTAIEGCVEGEESITNLFNFDAFLTAVSAFDCGVTFLDPEPSHIIQKCFFFRLSGCEECFTLSWEERMLSSSPVLSTALTMKPLEAAMNLGGLLSQGVTKITRPSAEPKVSKFF